MSPTEPSRPTPRRPRRKRFDISIDLDLQPKLAGFGSAGRVTAAHHRIAKHYASPLILGPPRSDALLEIVAHMYTEDEADVVQHLPPLRARTAAKVAKRSGRTAADTTRVLEHLSGHKHILLGWGQPQRYSILPLVPGTFEMSLMTTDLGRLNSWHQRFAQLFEGIWNTGYVRDYVDMSPKPVRYLPVVDVAQSLYTAWPSDRLESILDRYDKFAVGHCQCRLLTRLAGEGCDAPTENCLFIGPMADYVLDRGLMRSISRQEALAAKREAELNGCVSWMVNEFGDPRGNVSCSCCGCCCHCLRTVNQFSAPGLISRPRFMPRRDAERCNVCGKCVRACPMGAWSAIGAQVYFEPIRCIGCGLCQLACGKTHAIELEPVAEHPRPDQSWGKLFAKSAPSAVRNTLKAWAKRTFGG